MMAWNMDDDEELDDDLTDDVPALLAAQWRSPWRCATCRWWDCGIPGEEGMCMQEFGDSENGSGAYIGACGPDFGCVHWEAK